MYPAVIWAIATEHVASLRQAVDAIPSETGRAAGQMLGASSELARQSETLRSQVDRFLADVRRASG